MEATSSKGGDTGFAAYYEELKESITNAIKSTPAFEEV